MKIKLLFTFIAITILFGMSSCVSNVDDLSFDDIVVDIDDHIDAPIGEYTINYEIEDYDSYHNEFNLTVSFEVYNSDDELISSSNNFFVEEGGEYTVIISVSSDGHDAISKEITISAISNLVIMTFDSNGGTLIEPYSENPGVDIYEPIVAPTKEGFVFDAWCIDDQLSIPYTFDVMPAADITLYAKWIGSVTMSFETYDGSSIDPISLMPGSTIDAPEIPTKENHVFFDWFADDDFSQSFNFTVMPQENSTVYVKWLDETLVQGFTYINYSCDYYTISGYTGSEENIYIPYEHDDLPVKGIESNAFDGNQDIRTVHINSNIESIMSSSFYGCTSLTDVYISSGIEEIGSNAFYGCSMLEAINIPDTVNNISSRSFGECISLESISIPSSVTILGDQTFYKSTSLTEIHVDEDNQDFQSIDGVLFNKSATILIVYAAGKIDTHYVVPDGVQEISHYSFEYNDNLTVVTLSDNVNWVGSQVFTHCINLITINISDSVSSISSLSFRGVSADIVIGEGSSIGEFSTETFYGYLGNEINIPASVYSIGYNVFARCDNLTTINVHEDNDNYVSLDGVLYNIDRTKIVKYPTAKSGQDYIIPNTVTSIEPWAFIGVSLNSITIPDSVIDIGGRAFMQARNITSITIPDSVISINNSAFAGCNALANVVIGNGVEIIGEAAFSSCANLSNITLSNSLVSIGNSAFGGSGITNLVLPNTIESIGSYAFYNSSLSSINLPSSLTNIGNDAFSDCIDLTSISIPSSLEVISNRLFSGCSLLANVIIPEGVTHIGERAFYGCEILTDIQMPDSLVEIGPCAFVYCGEFVDVLIPNGVTKIGYDAFSNLAIESVMVGNSVTEIEANAFISCTELISFTILTDVPPTLGVNVFNYCHDDLKIYVPNNSVDDYKSSWSDYADIIFSESL